MGEGEGDGDGAGLPMLSVVNTMLTRRREVRAPSQPILAPTHPSNNQSIYPIPHQPRIIIVITLIVIINGRRRARTWCSRWATRCWGACCG